MESLTNLLTTLLTNLFSLSSEQLLALIAIGVIGLSAFALHVVLTVVKQAHHT